jgi:hypothetical protein
MQESCCDTLTGQYEENCAVDLTALQTFLSANKFKQRFFFNGKTEITV